MRVVLRSPIFFFLPAPEILDLWVAIGRSQKDFEAKIAEAFTALNQASSVVSELQEALSERVTSLENLQVEYNHLCKLSAVENEKAKPLLIEIERTLGTGRGKERWVGGAISLAVGLVIYAVGYFTPHRAIHEQALQQAPAKSGSLTN